ncbi:MAG: DUF2851 family protein [Flavobacteriales bacterium]
MNEKLLHYIWQYCQFDVLNLKTTSNLPVVINNVGQPNTNAGADFKLASIKINDIEWRGDVELHFKSSDWNKHFHQKNPKYNSVILHVVWLNDGDVINSKGELIQCLELKPIVNPKMLNKYFELMNRKKWVLCQDDLKTIDSFIISQFLSRLSVERMEQKSKQIIIEFEENTNDWETTFYNSLSYSLGLKVNAFAFLRLAKLLPLNVLKKHRDNLLQMEALLFGTAGFLKNVVDSYGNDLKKEYQFLKHKYKLNEMEETEWMFLRLRPASFPTIRIAQLAQLIYSNPNLFSKIISCNHISELKAMFSVQLDGYWMNHYHFKKKSVQKKKKLGQQIVDGIIINSICPLLVIYSKRKNLLEYQDKAIRFLEDTAAEYNIITKRFSEFGLEISSAFHSQALIQLKSKYCDIKNCLNCNIGNVLLSQQ